LAPGAMGPGVWLLNSFKGT